MPFRQLKSFLKILIGVQYERVNSPSPPPFRGHLSHRERQVTLIRLALAADARATYTMEQLPLAIVRF